MTDDDGGMSLRQTQRQVGGADQQLASVKAETVVVLIHGNLLFALLAGRFLDLRQRPPAGGAFECESISFERVQSSQDLARTLLARDEDRCETMMSSYNP